jgi:UDP-glucuronate decarboxylase
MYNFLEIYLFMELMKLKLFFTISTALSLTIQCFSSEAGAPKRALVAGGSGFLGSHLCDRLIDKGYDVICIDNLSSGDRKNIAHLIGHPRFKNIEADIAVSIPYDEAVDEIYNMACPASPPFYQTDPIQTWKSSVLGSLHLLEFALHCNAKIFQASTSEIYGDPTQHPQTESYHGNVNPIGVRSCYDEGKRCAESLFFDYWRMYGVQIKVGRIFNTYGPRMRPDDGRVVSNMIVQALQGNPLTIYGTGNQTRSFCYVSDLIDAILLFMDTPPEIIGPMNLGNPNEFTINELAVQVISATNSASTLTYYPLPQDDPRVRCPDISFAKQLLNWEPKIALSEGLQLTIDYFSMNQSENHLPIAQNDL